MSIEPKPKFTGQITITALNNKIDFDDTVGGAGTATVASGSFFVEAYRSAVEDALNAALAGWTVTISDTTGEMTISRATTWFPKITAAEINKCLTGGDTNADTDLALGTGEIAPDHGGFVQDLAVPAAALSHTSDQWIGSGFWPDESPAEDSRLNLKKIVRAVTTPRGDMFHADYSGKGRGIEQRTLRFEFETEPNRNIQADTWWRWYASQGSLIRYYPDREANAFLVYKLTQESAEQDGFNRQFQGFAFFEATFTLQRVWDQLEGA